MSFLSSAQKDLVDRIGGVVDDVEARMMLGTVGLFASDAQFGILEEGRLYLCVDEESRSAFAEAGSPTVRGRWKQPRTWRCRRRWWRTMRPSPRGSSGPWRRPTERT